MRHVGRRNFSASEISADVLHHNIESITIFKAKKKKQRKKESMDDIDVGSYSIKNLNSVEAIQLRLRLH